MARVGEEEEGSGATSDVLSQERAIPRWPAGRGGVVSSVRAASAFIRYFDAAGVPDSLLLSVTT